MTPKTREEYEHEERRQAFNRWWLQNGAGPVSRMPSQLQFQVHKLVKAAYMKGAKTEARKNEPVRVGGE